MAREKPGAVERIYSVAAVAVVFIFLLLVFSILRTSVFGHIEEEKHVYFEIVLLLLLAVLAELAVFYLRLQNVVVLMLLGIIIGPSFMHLFWGFLLSLGLPFALPSVPPEIIREPNVVQVFAQLGAVILLFKVGLHSRIERIFSKENVLVALAGVIVPFVAGYFYASLAGGSFAYAMFMGAALTATSVGVTVALLRELDVLNRKFSEVIIGAAVIDDILSLLALSLVINITAAADDALMPLITTFITAVVFVVGSILAGKYFIAYYDRREMGARRFLVAIAFMLFLAYSAEVIGLSAIVGAFLAGVILNRSRHYSALEEKTYGLELIFMPIFFISLGMLVDVEALAVFIVPIAVITVIAVLTKLIGCGAAALGAKMSMKDSLIIGFGMSPRGEVALIIGAIGLSKAVLTPVEYSIISAMALLTAFIAPPVLAKLIRKTGK